MRDYTTLTDDELASVYDAAKAVFLAAQTAVGPIRREIERRKRGIIPGSEFPDDFHTGLRHKLLSMGISTKAQAIAAAEKFKWNRGPSVREDNLSSFSLQKVRAWINAK